MIGNVTIRYKRDGTYAPTEKFPASITRTILSGTDDSLKSKCTRGDTKKEDDVKSDIDLSNKQ